MRLLKPCGEVDGGVTGLGCGKAWMNRAMTKGEEGGNLTGIL